MKTAVVAVALACLAPGLGFAASLTGSNVVSSAAVNLPAVGTLDWARWPGYTHKGTAISDVTTTSWVTNFTNGPRLIGDYSGMKTGGVGASFTFTVAATTAERTLTYYIGGWNSAGKITATLSGAPTYTTTFSSSTTYSRVITLKFRADSPGTLRVTYTQTSSAGSINMQAAALSQAASSAVLTWAAPTLNSDGSPLTDLAAFKVYWGTTPGTYSQSTKISNAASRTYTVGGLTTGKWYFAVTALNAKGDESPFSNVWSKTVP
ncbi:MAG TPA: fibronectin type III domain-containing protein [Gammaproteobacteria bacterium]